MSLIDERYAGRRPQLWEGWTSVEFTITAQPNPTAIPQPSWSDSDMTQEPVFGPLDEYVDSSQHASLVKLLSEGAVLVTFENHEGNTRTMICTTWDGAIPTAKQGKVKGKTPSLKEVAFAPDPTALGSGPYKTPVTKPVDKNLFKVFAIDLQEWRSFRFERVKSFTKYI